MRREPQDKKAALRRIRWSVVALELWVLLVVLYVFIIKKMPFTLERGIQLGISFLLPLLLYFVYRWQWRIRSRSSAPEDSDQQ
ncbi:hypothetical protein [Porphyromonas circumdentaria]|uniref:Uncharacterized protein n=1 Tax=Porphyromonas circumdentaria TaxID=29524 RepID=A0A1T4NV04_9PORP|nr:hypothetical protein [Porphyromonas circumdentaria]MBB6276208.1 hypothetical protein [Porphyromonas circumdentaria]SJZ82995.1 hypothetical protein SAMN02745171_01240 [Porphyromonas circumdentaria]